MTDQKDPKDNPLNNFLENPVTVGVMILIVLIGIGTGHIYGWYGLILILLGGYIIYRSVQKRKGGEE